MKSSLNLFFEWTNNNHFPKINLSKDCTIYLKDLDIFSIENSFESNLWT